MASGEWAFVSPVIQSETDLEPEVRNTAPHTKHVQALMASKLIVFQLQRLLRNIPYVSHMPGFFNKKGIKGIHSIEGMDTLRLVTVFSSSLPVLWPISSATLSR